MVCDRCGKEYGENLCPMCCKQQNMDKHTTPDTVTKNLRIWSRRLRITGRIVTGIMAVSYILIMILNIWSQIEIHAEFASSYKNLNMSTTFIQLLNYAVSTVKTYFVFQIGALGTDALANIVHNTRAAAELAEYNTRNQ